MLHLLAALLAFCIVNTDAEQLDKHGLQAGMHLTVKRSLSPRKSADSTTMPTTFTMPAPTTS